jgi:glycosyltransferase involved in cell wall biosynthesis
MISYDMQDFGGLEEYAVNLAIGLRQQGHAVSYLSAASVSAENQYFRRLKANRIPLFQPPAWISMPASDWPAKEKILRVIMWFLSPVTFGLGSLLSLLKRRSLRSSWTSSYNWLKGQLMDHLLGRDYRPWIGRALLAWWKFRWRPDLLHIQGYTTTLLFAIDWAHAHNLAVLYEEHQTPDPQFNWWKGFERTINKADRAVAVSEKSAQGLREVCGVTQPIVVRGPLLSDPFPSGWPRSENGRTQNGKSMTITTLARLYVTKGLTYLLEAAAQVKKTHPNAQFRVYGEGELREELLAKAARLGLDGEKIFPGAFTTREQLTQIMESTDIFVLSSVLEGQPLVIVEAMAYGRPIVTTNVGGIPELIQDGVNGLLCPPENPGCLADKIRFLLDDPALRQHLGAAARKSYERSPFQPHAVSSRFITVYGEVLEERRKSRAQNP